MSNPPSPNRPALPPAAVDRVFARMLAIYGVQRMTAAWGEVPPEERHAVWGGAIARAVWSPATDRYDLASVGDALDDLAADASTWPPTSGEFAERCERKAQRPGRNMLALPVPRRTDAELAAGREQMGRIKAMLAGAMKRPPTGRGAQREPGCDDEPPPVPACTCFVGLMRAEMLCPTCSGSVANRVHAEHRREHAKVPA